MFQPWLAHYFPGVTLAQIEAGSWTLSGYVEMADFARDQTGPLR
jgi:hypothetical protein